MLKNRKLLTAEKLGNILAFDKESERKLSYISADSFIENNIVYNFMVEIFFMPKWNIF